MIFRPGKVPKEYLSGKRMKYVNPFRLYINISILFFLTMAVIAIVNNYTFSEEAIDAREETNSDFFKINFADSTNVTFLKLDSIAQLKKLINQNIDSTLQNSYYLDSLKSSTLEKNQKDSIYNLFFTHQLSKALNNSLVMDNLNTASEIKRYINDYTQGYLHKVAIDYTIPEDLNLSFEDELIKFVVGDKYFRKISRYMQYDQQHPNVSAGQALKAMGQKPDTWNIFVYKKAQDLNQFKTDKLFRNNYIQSVISKTSIALFLMLPVFAVFVMLFYIRHPYNYTAHLIFVFSVQTVFFILLLIFNLFDNIAGTDLGTLLFIPTFLFYLERSMKNFYGQSWWKTFIKMAMLSIIFIILAIAGFVIVSFVTFLI